MKQRENAAVINRTNKKILIDCDRFLPTPSGLQYYAKNLVESLMPYWSKITLYGPYTIHNLPLKGRLRYSRLGVYLKKIPTRISGYNLVHLTHQTSEVFDFISEKAKVVLTVHDLNPLHLRHDDMSQDIFISKLRKNLSRADHVVTISQYVKNDLCQYAELFPEFDIEKVSVIHNGLSFNSIPVEYNKVDLPQPLQQVPYIISIGQTTAKKNLLSLVRMLSYLEKEHLVFIVDYMGNEYAKELQQEATKLGIRERVHFFVKVEEHFKHLLLHYAEAMCHPSLLEGFGYPPVECMWHGRPVFLSKLTALPEIGGDVAYYFDNFEPEVMANVYKEGMNDFYSCIEKKRGALRKRALLFSQEAMGRNYNALYEKLLITK